MYLFVWQTISIIPCYYSRPAMNQTHWSNTHWKMIHRFNIGVAGIAFVWSWSICGSFCSCHRWWSPVCSQPRVVHWPGSSPHPWSLPSEPATGAVSNCGIWKNPVQNDISKPIMAFIIIIIERLWPQSNDTVSSTFSVGKQLGFKRLRGGQTVVIWTLHSLN